MIRGVFLFADGDLHIDLRLDSQIQDLANAGPALVELSYPRLLVLVPLVIAGFGVTYSGISLKRRRSKSL